MPPLLIQWFLFRRTDNSTLTTPTKEQKIKVEKEDVVDLTLDLQYVDSAEGFDPDWKSSRPASPMQAPRSTNYLKPGKFMQPTVKLGATSKPAARGSATSSAASSDNTVDESYTYGKKRGRQRFRARRIIGVGGLIRGGLKLN